MNRIIISVCFLLSSFSELMSQSCTQIWEKSRVVVDSKQRLNLVSKYIDSDCMDSIAEAFILRGKLYNESGDTAFANKDFRNAVRINPDISEGWYQLASSVYLINNSDSIGLIFINYAVNLNSKNWNYLMLRGDIQIARHNFKNALNDYERSVDLINNSKNKDKKALTSTYNAIGGILIELSQIESNEENKTNSMLRAIESLYQAVKIDSLFDNAFFLLGNAFFYQKKYEESIENYEKCLKINPTRPFLLTNLSMAYREAGKYFGEQKHDILKAIEYLSKSYQLNPKEVETLRLLGVANGISGESENALNWFIKASELDPNNASVWWNLGSAYGNLGKKKEMKKCRKNALRIDPDIEKKM